MVETATRLNGRDTQCSSDQKLEKIMDALGIDSQVEKIVAERLESVVDPLHRKIDLLHRKIDLLLKIVSSNQPDNEVPKAPADQPDNDHIAEPEDMPIKRGHVRWGSRIRGNIKNLYENSMPSVHIAAITGIPHGTISGWASKHGWEVGKIKAHGYYNQMCLGCVLYATGRSQKEIASILQVAQSTVSSWASKYNWRVNSYLHGKVAKGA